MWVVVVVRVGMLVMKRHVLLQACDLNVKSTPICSQQRGQRTLGEVAGLWRWLIGPLVVGLWGGPCLALAKRLLLLLLFLWPFLFLLCCTRFGGRAGVGRSRSCLGRVCCLGSFRCLLGVLRAVLHDVHCSVGVALRVICNHIGIGRGGSCSSSRCVFSRGGLLCRSFRERGWLDGLCCGVDLGMHAKKQATVHTGMTMSLGLGSRSNGRPASAAAVPVRAAWSASNASRCRVTMACLPSPWREM